MKHIHKNIKMKLPHLTSLTVTQRRQLRKCRHSRSRPDTAALSGCRPSLSPCWELFQRMTTAAQPSLSSSFYTGPWHDTGSTGTYTVNKHTHRNKCAVRYNGILIPDENMDSKVWVVNLWRGILICSCKCVRHTQNLKGWTHHVDNLRAGVSVFLYAFAGAKVLSFTHQQHLLWVIHCQADLQMFNTSFYFLQGESVYNENKWI